jgi:hypothetical protein
MPTDSQTANDQPGSLHPAGSARKRGLVCMFCGEAWGYEGEQPTEALLKDAVEHEAKCPRNPYLAEIASLRHALSVIERRLREDTDPILTLVRACGGDESKRAWKHAIYASAIHAQAALHSPNVSAQAQPPGACSWLQ